MDKIMNNTVNHINELKIVSENDSDNLHKLYKIFQTKNNDDCDTYDSAIVCAPDEETAKRIYPGGGIGEHCLFIEDNPLGVDSSWVTDPNNVKVEYIGVSNNNKYGVILASYNRG